MVPYVSTYLISIRLFLVDDEISEREREREREREQTDSRSDMLTHRHTDRQT